VSAPPPPVGLGILGFGVAGRAMATAAEAHPDIEVVAVADPRLDAAVELGGRRVPACHGAEDLCDDGSVQAVYVATPTELHREHVTTCLSAGRLTVVEKPMAVTLADAESMLAAAARAGKVLLVGHSQSYEAPVRGIRQVVRDGEIGAVRFISALNGTDWIYRPRRPADLDARLGGGVTLRQGSHHFDVVRYVAGGRVRSVRARVGRWDGARVSASGEVADGAYMAFLEFEDGAVATVTYNGYDRFPATDLTEGISETGRVNPVRPGTAHREALRMDSDEELRLQARQGNRRDQLSRAGALPPAFGFLLVSGTHGDVRITRRGLAVYGTTGVREVSLAGMPNGRHALLDELVGVCRGLRSPEHDGAWGMATLEVCLAVLDSADSGTEVRLRWQNALKEDESANG
jgi:phthalate 4,5-cis-dihydrodiol dehydrogenase